MLIPRYMQVVTSRRGTVRRGQFGGSASQSAEPKFAYPFSPTNSDGVEICRKVKVSDSPIQVRPCMQP